MIIKEMTSLQNPLVKHLVKLRQNHDYRWQQGHIIIEGLKVITEVSQQNEVKTLVVSHAALIPSQLQAQEIVVVPPQVIEKISGTCTSEGILAEVAMPAFSSLNEVKNLIVLDEVNDPGNLGTLLRTALALGWEGAFIVNGSCDPYNEKAMRAARGATFRLPFRMGNWDELEIFMKNKKFYPLAADIEGESIEKHQGKENILLVLGNEARGPSEKASKLCQKVSIPMPGQMESLNVAVAGGILLYTLRGK